jgi:hypothetical protein
VPHVELEVKCSSLWEEGGSSVSVEDPRCESGSEAGGLVIAVFQRAVKIPGPPKGPFDLELANFLGPYATEIGRNIT